MTVGDRFIRYSKDGVVRGEVAKTWSRVTIDLKNMIVIRRDMITSTSGQVYEACECFLVEREISIPFLKRIIIALRRKSRPSGKPPVAPPESGQAEN